MAEEDKLEGEEVAPSGGLADCDVGFDDTSWYAGLSRWLPVVTNFACRQEDLDPALIAGIYQYWVVPRRRRAQRQFEIAAKAAVEAIFMDDFIPSPGPHGPKRRKVAARLWKDHLAYMGNAGGFKKRFRMELESFMKLLERIRPNLRPRDTAKGKASRGQFVEDEIRLAVAIRWFAGGRMQDLADLFELDVSACYPYVYDVVDAVNATFRIDFPMNDDDALEALAAGFVAQQKSTALFRRCVGAVDGVHFHICAPSGDVLQQVFNLSPFCSQVAAFYCLTISNPGIFCGKETLLCHSRAGSLRRTATVYVCRHEVNAQKSRQRGFRED
jgi:hypothetical protein